jgi:hypothetical protein
MRGYETVQIHCRRCGLLAIGEQVNGRRRVRHDHPVTCSQLFDGHCRSWDKAVSEAWLQFDGLIDPNDD